MLPIRCSVDVFDVRVLRQAGLILLAASSILFVLISSDIPAFCSFSVDGLTIIEYSAVSF